jgi:putative ABC transport system permease protein
MITSIIIGLISAGLIVALGLVIKKKLSGGQTEQINALVLEVSELDRKIDEIQSQAKDLISKSQADSAQEQLESARAAITAEKSNLAAIERKLDKAQKLVEGKEAIQQELKSGKAEDERKMAELLAGYADISAESVMLEQQLAASMKNLDQIMSEVDMTVDQRSVLQDLSGALTTAGSRLRDLIMEYQQTNERLQALNVQHKDLEEEYTRLVEQQLGD